MDIQELSQNTYVPKQAFLISHGISGGHQSVKFQVVAGACAVWVWERTCSLIVGVIITMLALVHCIRLHHDRSRLFVMYKLCSSLWTFIYDTGYGNSNGSET